MQKWNINDSKIIKSEFIFMKFILLFNRVLILFKAIKSC